MCWFMKARKSKHVPASLFQRRTLAFLLVGAILGGALGVGYARARKPWFRSKLVLRIGEFGFFNHSGKLDLRSLEHPAELTERLGSSYGDPWGTRSEDLGPYLHRVRVSPAYGRLVTLEGRSESGEGGVAFLKEIGEELLRDHQRRLGEADALLRGRREGVLESLRVIDNSLAPLGPGRVEAGFGGGAFEAFLHIERGVLASRRASASRELHLLDLARFYSTPTRILQQPIAQDVLQGAFSRGALGTSSGLAGALLGLVFALWTLPRRDN